MTPAVFDRRAVRQHRNRAALRLSEHDFLFREVAQHLAERLDDVNRDFHVTLELGAHGDTLTEHLAGRNGIEKLVRCDQSAPMVTHGQPASCVVADEEWLPYAPASFDLIVSSLSLHWVNDLPGALVQIRRALKPDGLFIGALFGRATLGELREVLVEAELAECGGAGPRVSPFVDVRDAGGLLQRAGFALPVVDTDTITVSYTSALDLMRDVRGMGESNAVAERRRNFTRRSTLLRAAAIYADRYADEEHRIPATFQIVTLTGWAPHEAQPRPLRPGSAARRLSEALETAELSGGEKASPRRSH
ncbi:MAG: methyltransferase domain-containing protein [Alphaproteobacteria bacterium]|nr:methyltransferase domain-containing protein [Alphaproteobacteria bacterium]